MRTRELARAWRGEVLLGALWLGSMLCGLLRIRNLYRAALVRLIRRTGLFDRPHYLESNYDVAVEHVSPLFHYAAYGDAEGRWPMMLFDPGYYRSQVASRTKHVNALLHYAHVGRYRRVSPSRWFDVEFYLSTNKDVFRAGLDPLRHYLDAGGLEGRSPCASFDGAYYLRSNPDVAEKGINPLIHYLKYGRYEERRTSATNDEAQAEIETAKEAPPRASLPTDLSWDQVAPRSDIAGASVDVIVPVYKGRAETLRCLYSVLTAPVTTTFELIVVDDASPDVQLAEDLRRLAGMGRFTLLANAQNRGFVHSINRGVALHAERDVVLLNSDAEVHNDWLDRLAAVANRNKRTATVTPLSNNATICSYPRNLHDNPYPLELDYKELDTLAGKVNHDQVAEAPTGIGFCMYVKRACISDVGMFDEAAFGAGYGEENDFCQRAINNGWVNLLAANVFVRHWGATSFQGEKHKRLKEGLSVINRRYPGYNRDVQRFIQRDPLGEARRRLDWARMTRRAGRENTLFVIHNRGGGSERRVREEIDEQASHGAGTFLMRPAVKRPSHVVLSQPEVGTLLNCQPYSLADTNGLAAALDELRITEIRVHSLADLSPTAPASVTALASRLGARLEVSIHDYKTICPRINLIDLNGRYCGEPDEDGCNRCLRERGSEFGVTDIRVWRAMRGDLLRNAHAVRVPDQDVATRLVRYFPDVTFTVSPHETIDARRVQVRHARLGKQEKLRIVVVGAISRMKGYDILRACAQDAMRRKLALEYVLMGYSLNDSLLIKSNVRVTGRYLEKDAEGTLRNLSPHLAWLPSLWPETYSYTLSLLLKCGMPVFAFDIGAIASRLRALHEETSLMPLSMYERPKSINEMFMQYRDQQAISLQF